MSQVPEYRLLDLDLTPLLQEAFERFRTEMMLDFPTFCQVVYRTMYGPYLRAREWDGLNRPVIEDAAWLVGRWAHTLYRKSQIQDSDIQELRPFIVLETDGAHCKGVKHLSGRWVLPDEVTRLPLDGCDNRCLCRFSTLSQRDLTRRGWSKDGPGIPPPRSLARHDD